MNRFRGALLGLACGDALGTSVEFLRRGEFVELTDMIGGGAFNLQPGQWTDDTSMALCLAESLIEKNGMDLENQLSKYSRWYHEGYLSSNGHCFDVGGTTSRAIRDYDRYGEVIAYHDDYSLGNGSIMRLAPVLMFYANDRFGAILACGKSSITTHSARVCMEACMLLGSVLFKALNGMPKIEVLFGDHDVYSSDLITALANGSYVLKTEDEIKGSGYVVESLEASLWCFRNTDNYRDAVLKAANLGDDADTTAAITGQIAGAFYGEKGIPAEWRAKIAMHDYIVELADKLRLHSGL